MPDIGVAWVSRPRPVLIVNYSQVGRDRYLIQAGEGDLEPVRTS